MSSRLQLALNVSNLDAAIAFYSSYFDATPAKVRPGYANFALEDPPLKLVLIESPDAGGSLNHLGVEVFSVEDVARANERFDDAGLVTRTEESTTCCYAVQDKVWVSGPDATSWETYVVLDDASTMGSGDACCTESVSVAIDASSTGSVRRA